MIAASDRARIGFLTCVEGLGTARAARRCLGRVTGLALLGALAVAGTGCGGDESAAAPAATGSTLRATLADPDGDGALDPGPAEPLGDRGAPARAGRTLATFAQITDAHVRDEESPARVPFLDRLGTPFDSTFRPHEALSTQVLAASVRAVNRLRPQAVVVTGDIVDSAQANELDQALAVLDGGPVRLDSGARGYAGVQLGANPDPLYYRPDNDAPRRPGLLARAQAPFTAPGLRAPWFPVLGNHDLLVAGEVVPTPRLAEVATGARAVVGLDPAFRPTRELDAGATLEALLADGDLPGRTTRVPPDPERRHLSAEALVARLRERVDALPFPNRLDYRFDIAPGVRGIALDTVRRDGGSRGSVSPEQVAWLRGELGAAGDTWVLVFSHNPLDASDGGEAALAALAASPRVVAAVSGHRHRNTITRAAGERGPWLIGTSSLADFPQQARAFRLREAAGGGVALETWMVDHDGAGLAGTARELAYLDAQGGRPKGFAGARGDRNVRLFVPAP